MANKPTTNRKPSHSVYHVRGEGENAFWTKVGAAWMHDDQGGLNVSLELLPTSDSGRLVIRAVKAEARQGEAA